VGWTACISFCISGLFHIEFKYEREKIIMVSDKECLFCRIVRGEIPAKKVYEDGVSFAFLDINPRNPGHTLVIPKEHYETVLDMPDDEAGQYFKSVKKVAALVKNGVNAQGLSISSSNGAVAGQVVAHQHFHVIPRFATEGPMGLEAILPSKRLDDKTMDQLVMAISKASPEASVAKPEAVQGAGAAAASRPAPRPAPRPAARRPEPNQRPSMNDVPRPTTGKPVKRKHKKPKEDEDFADLDDEISFDF
jgi:histidine triad (HIT) family protein